MEPCYNGRDNRNILLGTGRDLQHIPSTTHITPQHIPPSATTQPAYTPRTNANPHTHRRCHSTPKHEYIYIIHTPLLVHPHPLSCLRRPKRGRVTVPTGTHPSHTRLSHTQIPPKARRCCFAEAKAAPTGTANPLHLPHAGGLSYGDLWLWLLLSW